jgi:hypothetical protein
MRHLLQGEEPFRPEAIPELEAPFARLRVMGAAWTGPELRGAVVLLRSARLTQPRCATNRDTRRRAPRSRRSPTD